MLSIRSPGNVRIVNHQDLLRARSRHLEGVEGSTKGAGGRPRSQAPKIYAKSVTILLHAEMPSTLENIQERLEALEAA